MNTKLTSGLVILMFYVSFMGPFVLKNMIRRAVPRSRARQTAETFTELLLEIACIIVCGIVMILCALIIAAIGWLLFIVGVVVLIGAYLLYDKYGRLRRRQLASGAGRRRRLSNKPTTQVKPQVQTGSQVQGQGQSQTQTKVKTEAELKKEENAQILKKMNDYYDRIAVLQNLDIKEAKAGANSIGQKMTKFGRTYLHMKAETVLPKNADQMKIAIRDAMDAEIEDVDKMLDEIAAQKFTATVDKYHQPNKTRRSYFKLRTGRAVNLILTDFNDRRNHQNSWENKYKLHTVEMDAIMAKLKDKATTADQRKAENEKLRKIMQANESGLSQTEQDEKDAKEMVALYSIMGVMPGTIRSIFFKSYSRATTLAIFKMTKIQFIRMLYESPLTEEQKGEVQNSIASIDESMKKMRLGADLTW